mmetsp:Transcript_6340/g.14325  ORF Transcript_6340/g.14325 Transcript_6340/m.14325 type:complete len:399 (-) Transcript_6340:84-1280(-)|eukprot:CAMPEP_0116822350 /NCGR_PEP_ID=MMETSP0418-20121206/220_1 /TAXON_ID=1158023 /ORGANISM="Astrosyne radiata, Strain 13vi08-1A" /LENGTH=398 /DNA_ID=CAMNT_0004450455 /DNA_START=211 /DNA_END=1407 /DNA_ORIENTATION=-
MRCVQDYNFKGKKALVRVDFNVPLDNQGNVVDGTRIQETIPTIQKVLDDGGAAILLSHLGRPQQGYEKRLSLRHIVPHLSQFLGIRADFASSCIGPATCAQVHHLVPGQVLLLENVRFHPGETTGDVGLAQEWASWGDVYVNDAFGTIHRAHTSTTLLAGHFQDKLAGYLLQKELNSADKIFKKISRPFVAIIGGAKISDKIRLLKRLLSQLDYLLVGGGVANAFQKSLGGQVGASLLESGQEALVRQLVQQAQQKNVSLVLPADVVVAPRPDASTAQKVVAGGHVPHGWMAVDLGPKAQQAFATILQTAQTILWCGPMGVFEVASFQEGTKAVAASVVQATQQGAFSLVGGGDSSAAIRSLGYVDQVSHLSTGGGALLAYLGGAPLPAVNALDALHV